MRKVLIGFLTQRVGERKEKKRKKRNVTLARLLLSFCQLTLLKTSIAPKKNRETVVGCCQQNHIEQEKSKLTFSLGNTCMSNGFFSLQIHKSKGFSFFPILPRLNLNTSHQQQTKPHTHTGTHTSRASPAWHAGPAHYYNAKLLVAKETSGRGRVPVAMAASLHPANCLPPHET